MAQTLNVGGQKRRSGRKETGAGAKNSSSLDRRVQRGLHGRRGWVRAVQCAGLGELSKPRTGVGARATLPASGTEAARWYEMRPKAGHLTAAVHSSAGVINGLKKKKALVFI